MFHIQLVIPKHHGAKLTDIPDEGLSEILVRESHQAQLRALTTSPLALTNPSSPTQPIIKKLVHATGASDYNILQNNGTIAHQQVHHVSARSEIAARLFVRCPQSLTGIPSISPSVLPSGALSHGKRAPFPSCQRSLLTRVALIRSPSQTRQRAWASSGLPRLATWTRSRHSAKMSSPRCKPMLHLVSRGYRDVDRCRGK